MKYCHYWILFPVVLCVRHMHKHYIMLTSSIQSLPIRYSYRYLPSTYTQFSATKTCTTSLQRRFTAICGWLLSTDMRCGAWRCTIQHNLVLQRRTGPIGRWHNDFNAWQTQQFAEYWKCKRWTCWHIYLYGCKSRRIHDSLNELNSKGFVYKLSLV